MIQLVVAQVVDLSVTQIVELVVGFGLLLVIAWVVRNSFGRWEKRLARDSPKATTTFRYLARLFLAAIILVGTGAILFAVFPGLDALISSLFLAAGFASIVIGLAAQSTLQNIFAGMSLSASQPLRINDAILFRNEFCFVEDLKLTYTVLRTWDNRRLMVPNSVMQSEVFINYTIVDPTKLVPIFLTISHESDSEKAIEIMLKAARSHPDSLPEGDLPKVQVMELDSTGVRLRLLTRAKDQPTAFSMARDILKIVKAEFTKNGIVIPYPRTHVIMDKDSAQEGGAGEQ